MSEVLVTTTINVPHNQLSEDDRNVPGEVTIQVNDDVELRFLANAALDIFHTHVAIDELDNFSFQTWARTANGRGARQVHEHPDAKSYAFSDVGTVLRESS